MEVTTTTMALAPEHGSVSAPSPAQSAAVDHGNGSDSSEDAPVVYELQHSPASQRPQQEEEDVAPEELQSSNESSLTPDADAAEQLARNEAADASEDEHVSEEDDDAVVVTPAIDPTVTSDRATADTSAATATAAITELQRLHAAAAALVSTDAQRKRLDDELQCILCHDTLFKPVTATCGHSFCRVCLLDSCLSRAIAEAQCPICRADVMRHFAESPTSIAFNVNVTLWNVIQLLVPAIEHRESQQEDDEYAHKLDQLTAKWRIHTLQTSADTFHRSNAADVDDDDDSVNDEDYEDGDEWRLDRNGDGWDGDDVYESESGDNNDRSFATDEARRRHRRRRQRQRALRRERVRLQNRYPELKVEHAVDGRLRVARNVVLDTDDANDDGLQTMRVSLALVEFPSIVERYSEHQECSLAVLKMEEDEEIDSGFPFFMNESGDDDALVVSTFYNHVTLKVFDDGGNNVLERTRAARQGIVDFPELRLDVPAGNYTFHFSDDLYGMYLTVKTTLSELTDVSDAPLQDRGYASYVADEATDTSRQRSRQRQREWTASDEEDALLADDDDAGHDSDDSFIVNDDEDAHGVTGAFSGDEGGDDGDREDEEAGAWSVHSDDEDADEAAAAQHIARRNRHRSRRPGVWDDDDDDEEEEGEDEDNGTEPPVHDMTGSEDSGSDDGAVDGRRHRHVVELVSQETDAQDHAVDDDEEDDTQTRRRPTGLRRVVLDSDGDGDGDGDDDDDDDDVNADDAPAPLFADSDVVPGRTPPQHSDSEEVQRPQTKRRTRTVVLSEDDDDDDGDEDDDVAATRFTPHKRQKTSARIDDGDDDDDDVGDRYDGSVEDDGEDDGEDDAPSFTAPHQWFDDGHNERHSDDREDDRDDDDAVSDDETRRLDPYDDDRASDDNDGRNDVDEDDSWQQEQDHQFEEEHYGEAGYGDDHDDDGGGGWY